MAKKMKNKLDEMQEQKMLKIEHNGCWLAFWGLLIALLIQLLIYGPGELRQMAGEWIVFMCLALYISIDCIRNGVWDRWLSPTPAANACASIIAGIIVAVLNVVLIYRRHHILSGAVAAGVYMGAMTTGLCFAALTCGAFIYKKRVKHLEQEETDENQEE